MDLSNVRILVAGPGQSGKSTFTIRLRNGLECCAWHDIGEGLMSALAEIHAAGAGPQFRAKLAHIRQFKNDYRADLIALANLLRRYDPAILIENGFRVGPIVCGVRTKSELDAWLNNQRAAQTAVSYTPAGFRPCAPRLVLIEIVRPGCAADNYELDNCANTYAREFHITARIVNDGTLDELLAHADGAARMVRGLLA